MALGFKIRLLKQYPLVLSILSMLVIKEHVNADPLSGHPPPPDVLDMNDDRVTFSPAPNTTRGGGQTTGSVLSRCPYAASKPGIYVFSDKKLCNVYHECNCTTRIDASNTTSICSFVLTNVCPIGSVFLNTTNKCEPIEIYGCDTSYLQTINIGQYATDGVKSSSGANRKKTLNNQTALTGNSLHLEKDYDQVKNRKGAITKDYLSDPSIEPVNITGLSEFNCPPGANERFPDPQVCNLFHVCVSRAEQTFDQPFLCPFSTIFRVIDSNTMYCDKRNKNDCVGKAFYRSMEDDASDDVDLIEKSILIDTNMNSTQCANTNDIIEDKNFCNLYHVCRDTKEYVYMCENQLLFNPLAQICDYPINIVCYNKKLFKLGDRKEKHHFFPSTHRVQATQQAHVMEAKTSTPSEAKPYKTTTSASRASQMVKNGTEVSVLGTKVQLYCPVNIKNYMIPDRIFCNLYHHCRGNYGTVQVCDKGKVFDINANGPEAFGACNFEEAVNCLGKYILTEDQAVVPGRAPLLHPPATAQQQQQQPKSNLRSTLAAGVIEADKLGNYVGGSYIPQQVANSREELVSGIPFDCRGRPNGHWRDLRYCDVFHACISGEQKKTYSCAQLGERIYFDETTRRCEFSKNNPIGCSMNTYFQSLNLQGQSKTNSLVFDEPNEAWKQFIRSREQFSCMGRMDGFYASRWCNVFYRCFLGVKTEFLCPKMLNSDRLWWVQHGSPQETPQTSAACVWPCETKKPCLSPGGSVIEVSPGKYEESVNEAERVWRSANCGTQNGGTSDIFKIIDQEFNCLGLSEGNFYASKYCNVFHRCANGKRRDFQCAKATNSPYDLWWNEETNQCDWPCKVNCNKPIYGTSKSAYEIQNEDRSLNIEECRKVVKSLPLVTPNVLSGSVAIPANIVPHSISQQQQQQQPQQQQHSTPQSHHQAVPLAQSQPQPQQQQQHIVPSKSIPAPLPDESYVCRGLGLQPSNKYCNVYYDCKSAYTQQPPSEAFFCLDGGYFDHIAKMCKPAQLVNCPHNPALVYPLISISETSPPEEVGCSSNLGPYVIHSTRYCNIYYTCDGRSSKPQAYRCYDRANLEEAVFSRERRRCEPKREARCEGEILPTKIKYQSSPVDHTRLGDLQPLTCRTDQQYLAEHDKYCNLYHSCILGKYQMYSCVTLGSFDRTSYFYYTNGDCSAPNEAQCGPGKSIYPYEKLFPSEQVNTQSSGNVAVSSKYNQQQQPKYTPIVSPSVNYKGQATFGSVSLKNNLPFSPQCNQEREKYLLPHSKYCNIFYECLNGELSTFACVDTSTGTFSGIFDEDLKSCKPFNQIDCPYGTLYNPEESDLTGVREYEREREQLQPKLQPIDYTFRTESNFSCIGKMNGYYESEWCNVFYRCINGKRIDAKCSSGQAGGYNNLPAYDLWWEHQNAHYDAENPIVFIGPDEDAKCEWPCKVPSCNKRIWVDEADRDGGEVTSRQIAARDLEIHPDCVPSQTMRPNVAQNTVQLRRSQQHQAYDTESLNPSGYYCEEDGIFRDPIYCNLFHICSGREKKTFQCRPVALNTGDYQSSSSVSIYDPERNACVSKEEGFNKCNGVIFDANFMNLPAYRDLPQPMRPCLDSGVFRAYDNDVKYCDLYYWCEKPFSEPLYFYCDLAASFGKETGSFFNMETRQCDLASNVKCESPSKTYSNVLLQHTRTGSNGSARQSSGGQSSSENVPQSSVEDDRETTVKNSIQNLLQSSPYMMQIISGLLDPAPGYLSLPSTQFQTTFKCPLNMPGYYPNNDYCDIFHYCYNNGQFKTYVCASMQNQYQLWWSHQTEPGRRDNIFCDWPCNLVGTGNTVCPSHKRVLMRDRQQISGGIGQQEVLSATCQNPVTQPYVNSNSLWKSERMSTIVPSENNYIPLRESKTSGGTVTGYAPCTNSQEWYVSAQIIKCDNEYRVHGFAPDPKDCSKFYRCDQTLGSDGASLGYLMSCVAGLWWDQSKRMCVLPSESNCNPYKIIATQGNHNFMVNTGCRLTCMQVGLAMKNQMKNIPGKPSSFYKCDGQCAIEMLCPTDLIFDNKNQRCEWVSQQFRMASLKADDGFSKLLLKNNNPRMIAQPLLSPLSLTLNATANATLPFDHTSPSYFSIPSFPSNSSSISFSSSDSQTQQNSTAMNLVNDN